MQNQIANFLTNRRNILCVLEVLHHGHEIRKRVTDEFWKGLQTHLLKTRPKKASRSLIWSLGSESRGLRGETAWLDAKHSAARDQAQNLVYRIEYAWWVNGCDLYLGLHWTQEIKQSSRILHNPSVAGIKSILEHQGYEFTETNWWWGWRYLENARFSSFDDFLIQFVQQRRDLFEAAADRFWALVQSTNRLVFNSNKGR